MFQSTPPHGGRLRASRSIKRIICFNPRPRMGGDTSACVVGFVEPVSIHAPAWGATLTLFYVDPPYLVSIHAPAWGATY